MCGKGGIGLALFYKRPLAAASALLIVTVFVSFFLSFAVVAGCVIFSALALFVLIAFCLRRGIDYRRLSLCLLAIALLLGGLRVMLDARGDRLWSSYLQTEAQAEVSVREVRYSDTYGSEFLVDVKTLNGVHVRSRAVLRCESAAPFYLGDRFSAALTVLPLGEGESDASAAYTDRADGARVLLSLENEGSVILLESGARSFSARLAAFRALLAHRLRGAVGGEAGNLLAALLLGARSGLSPASLRDFRRAGASHLLALSGLHLVLLAGLFDRLLLLFGVGKKARIAAVLPFAAVYLVLTGCGYSMLRAVAMLCFVYLAYLLGGDHDAPTALFVSGAVILLISPAAVLDLSYQMTMLATFGLLAFGRLQGALTRFLPRRRGWLSVPLFAARYLLSSLFVSLSATLAILPVLWLCFGEMSLLTPLSNLVLVPLAVPLLVSALLTLALPIAPFAWVGRSLGDLALFLAGKLSALRGMLSLRYAFVPYIFIPLIALTALLLLLDLRRFKAFVLSPALVAAAAFAICLAVCNAAGKESIDLCYRRAGQNEGIVLMQNGDAVLCDSSNGSLTQLRADWAIAREHGATEAQTLMLTHYHARMTAAVSRFSQSVIVRELWLPEPVTEADGEIFADLYAIAQKRGLAVRVYAYDTALSIFEDGEISVSYPLYEARSTQPAQAIGARFGDTAVCYHTAALSEFARHADVTHDCNADALILGAHGPVPHESVTLPDDARLSEVLVGSEQITRLLDMRAGLRYEFYAETYDFILK